MHDFAEGLHYKYAWATYKEVWPIMNPNLIL